MIYAIVGPTGVGKTLLSIKLAKEINAEIINCDSMQIYKELNIGTAKATVAEQEGIIHYLLNIKSVSEDYSVYDYQQDARKCIDEIRDRGKNIIFVGGTGLYLKAALYDYEFNTDKKTNEKVYDFKLIGLTRDRDNLYNIINNRVDQMFDSGLLEEVKELYDKKINTRAINTAIGYKELYKYFDKEITLEEAKEEIKQSSRNYAKRQYTFFNNQFDNIEWFNVEEIPLDEIIEKIKRMN